MYINNEIANRAKTVNLSNSRPVPLERIKEQIKYATEILRWYVVIFIAIATGEINLLFRMNLTSIEFFFRNSGVLIILGIGIVIFYHNRYVFNLIKKIK